MTEILRRWHERGYVQPMLLVALLLLPPYTALLVCCYWLFVDNQPPLRVEYQHAKFVSMAVTNRQDAIANQIDEAVSGQTVWIYRELCMDARHLGTIQASWVTGAFVWQSPVRDFPSVPGCISKSYAIQAPSTNPSRDFLYSATIRYELNPLVTAQVELPLLALRVLAK